MLVLKSLCVVTPCSLMLPPKMNFETMPRSCTYNISVYRDPNTNCVAVKLESQLVVKICWSCYCAAFGTTPVFMPYVPPLKENPLRQQTAKLQSVQVLSGCSVADFHAFRSHCLCAL